MIPVRQARKQPGPECRNAILMWWSSLRRRHRVSSASTAARRPVRGRIRAADPSRRAASSGGTIPAAIRPADRSVQFSRALSVHPWPSRRPASRLQRHPAGGARAGRRALPARDLSPGGRRRPRELAEPAGLGGVPGAGARDPVGVHRRRPHRRPARDLRAGLQRLGLRHRRHRAGQRAGRRAVACAPVRTARPRRSRIWRCSCSGSCSSTNSSGAGSS